MIVWVLMCPIHPMVDHPYISLGERYVTYITILWYVLSLFIMELVYRVHWLSPYLIDLEESLNSEWESITEFRIPPCEFFPDLLLFLSIIFTTFLSLEMT